MRLWLVAVVAERFHVLPSVAARDLDEDPEHLSLLCMQLLRYAEAKNAFEAAEDKAALGSSEMMSRVARNTFDLHKERLKARGL